MAPPAFLSHPSSLEHETGPHPECPERIEAIFAALEARDWVGWERIEARPATSEEILAVHPLHHVERLQSLAGRGGGAIDMDTVVSAGSWEAARHGAGSACQVVDLVASGDAPYAFSACRPPGHHAETDRAMGFCLLSNAAIAAQHALDAHGLERVLVLDWDVHHGNGTQEIFYGRSDVLYASIHQSPLYPGTGAVSETGSGDGRGFTLNLPVPARSGDAMFCSLVEHVVVPVARAYRPQLVLLSAGYDAHADDPIGGCRVTEAGYAAMTASMRRLAGDLGAPLGVVLEGGYDLAALGRSVVTTMEVLGADAGWEEPAAAIERHPIADAAAARFASSWPDAGLLPA